MKRKYWVIVYFLVYVLLVYGGFAIVANSPYANAFIKNFLIHKAAELSVELQIGKLDTSVFHVRLELEQVKIKSAQHGIQANFERVRFSLSPLYLLSGMLIFDEVRLQGGNVEVRHSFEGASVKTQSKFKNIGLQSISIENVKTNIVTDVISGACQINEIVAKDVFSDQIGFNLNVERCPLFRKNASPFEISHPVDSLHAQVELESELVKVKTVSLAASEFEVSVNKEGTIHFTKEMDLWFSVRSRPSPVIQNLWGGLKGQIQEAEVHLQGQWRDPKAAVKIKTGALEFKKRAIADRLEAEIEGQKNDFTISRANLQYGQSQLEINHFNVRQNSFAGELRSSKIDVRELMEYLTQEKTAYIMGDASVGVDVSGEFDAAQGLKQLLVRGDLDVSRFEVLHEKQRAFNPAYKVIQTKDVHYPVKCKFRSAQFVCEEGFLVANGVPLKISIVAEKDRIEIPYDASAFDIYRVTPYVHDLKIQGKGRLLGKVVIVPGSANLVRIEGTVDMDDSAIDDVRLGKVQAAATYDYDTDLLKFMSARVQRLNAKAEGEVVVDTAKGALRGRARFRGATGQEITDWGLGYLPAIVQFRSGEWAGDISFSGETKVGAFDATLKLDGEHAEWMGQLFDRQKILAHGNKSGFYVDTLELSRGPWKWQGEFSVKPDLSYVGTLRGQSMRLSDITLPRIRPTQLNGSARLDLRLKGDQKRADVVASVQTQDLQLNEIPVGDVQVKYEFHQPLQHSIELRTSAENNFEWLVAEKASIIKYTLNKYNIFPFLQLVFPLKPNANNKLLLTSQGEIRSRESFWDVEKIKIKTEQMSFISQGSTLVANPFFLETTPGGMAVNVRLAGPSDAVDAGASSAVQVSLDGSVSAHGDGDIKIRGNVDLAWMADWIDIVDWSRGAMKLNAIAQVRRWGLLGIRGEGSLANAMIDFSFLDEKITDLNSHISFGEHSLLIDSFSGKVGGGVVTCDGEIGYPWVSDSKMDLLTSFQGVKLRPYPDLNTILEGRLQLVGKKKPYTLKGNIQIVKADLVGDQLSEEFTTREMESRFLPQKFQKGQREWFLFDFGVSIPSQFRIESRQFNGDLKGEFRVIGSDIKPLILGDIVVNAGDFAIRESQFTIDSGSLRFENQARIDPLLNLSSHMDIDADERHYRIFLNVLGSWSRPRLEYSSDPPLSREDITSLVVFGVTTQKFAQREGQDVLPQELVPQVFARTGISRNLEKSTGIKLRLDTDYSETRKEVLPRISVSRRLGRKAEVKFISNIENTGYRELNVQYQINKNLSVKGLWEGKNPLDTTGTTGTASTGTVPADPVNSFGGDVRFKVEFE